MPSGVLLIMACLRIYALCRCPGAKTKAFPVPMLSVEAEQELQCDAEAWGMSWTEQVSLSSTSRLCVLFSDPVCFSAVHSKVQQRHGCLPFLGTWRISRFLNVSHSSLFGCSQPLALCKRAQELPTYHGLKLALCSCAGRDGGRGL